jgi:hypothetical protein
LQRHLGSGRPRKLSVSKRAREPHHQRKRSRGSGAEMLRRIDDRLRPDNHNRKALSAEPSADLGKRWEDLIVAADQAASAAGDLNEERTPVSTWHPTLVPFTPPLTVSRRRRCLPPTQAPQSPPTFLAPTSQPFSLPPLTGPGRAAASFHHDSPPPLHLYGHHHHDGHNRHALTPPTYAQEPFPSVESNGSAGSAPSASTAAGVVGIPGGPPPVDPFGMEQRALLTDSSSPTFSSQNTLIYCAACQGASLLRESFACTECICGICQACVEVLLAEQGARRQCPRCFTIGGKFKPFQLDIR